MSEHSVACLCDHAGLQSPDIKINPLHSFSSDSFEAWPSWKRLKRLLTPTPAPNDGSNVQQSGQGQNGESDLRGGAAFGLAGPRGAGKTWHMQRAVQLAREREGFGLWYPSPSEYDSLAFLASLTEALANEIEREHRQKGKLGYAFMGRPVMLLAVAYIFIFFSAIAFWVAYANVGLTTLESTLVGLWIGAIGLTLTFAARRLRRANSDMGRLLIYSDELRRSARFALTRRESSELGFDAGRGGVLGKLRRSRDIELVERPLTLAALVQDFRELVRLAAVVAYPGPVVVAVDELDKMNEHEKVRQLLRDIKGVFGVPNVYFLVSVSHEAARALNLNGLAERNEFNSSFDTVVELPTLEVKACQRLLENRGFPGLAGVAGVLGVLSGGIPRDLVRLTELVISESSGDILRDNATMLAEGAVQSVTEIACAAVLRVEALELRREIVSTGENQELPVTDEAKLGVFRALPERGFDSTNFVEFTEQVSAEYWEPHWADEAWSERFGEAWRRLMVRLAVAYRLGQVDDEDEIEYLRTVVATSSHSAAVAREMLSELPSGAVA